MRRPVSEEHRLFKIALANIKKFFYSNLLSRRLSDKVGNTEKMSADLPPHLQNGDSDGRAGGPGRRCLI